MHQVASHASEGKFRSEIVWSNPSRGLGEVRQTCATAEFQSRLNACSLWLLRFHRLASPGWVGLKALSVILAEEVTDLRARISRACCDGLRKGSTPRYRCQTR